MKKNRRASARLLVSVRNPGEALAALDGGANLIDLKEPQDGALGATPQLTRQLVRARLRARPLPRGLRVSATVGDPPYSPVELRRTARATARSGADYVKVGVDPSAADALTPLRALQGGVARTSPLVAVLFADRLCAATDRELGRWIQRVAGAGFRGIMLDTAGKERGGLLAHVHEPTLHSFVATARRAGLLTGLAGSLSVAELPAVAALGPDYVGVRGAVCDRRRTGSLVPARVRAARRQLSEQRSRARTTPSGSPAEPIALNRKPDPRTQDGNEASTTPAAASASAGDSASAA